MLLLSMAATAMTGMAQEVPNGSFAGWENWDIPAALGGGAYSRPTGGWDCLNSLAPGSCAQVEGRTAGSTAALLTSKEITVPMDGGKETFYTSCMMLGDFHTAFTEGEPSWGIPFTSTPKKFVFWYKYLPVSGDKGRIYLRLWQGDFHNSVARWKKKVTLTETVSDWTKVEVDLTAADENGEMLNFMPTKLLVEVTSTISGISNDTKDDEMSTVTQEGSQLYITDMTFEYGTEEHAYTVCGSSEIFGPGPKGYGWDTTDTGNDMTPAGDNIYQLVKNNVALQAGVTYEYKVVQDHSWNVNWGIGGQNGANFTLTVPTDGDYNVTFTFNLNEGTCPANAVSTSGTDPVTQIPNGSFAGWENWDIPAALGGGAYSRPTGGWDCLNSLAPGSCTQVEGRTAGSTAALLTSKEITVPMDGGKETFYTSCMMLGDFLTAFTEGEPSWGIPFTSTPKKFVFWYKYLPVSGDKGRIYLRLWQGNFHNSVARWRKKVTLTETVSDWTKVEVDLTAADENGEMLNFMPTMLLVEVTSTISGISNDTKDHEMSTVTQEGSQLYITEMQFSDEPVGIGCIASDPDTAIGEKYDLTGRKLSAPAKGIYIIRSGSGQMKKVLLK